jgi:hypothetical protein
MRTKVLTTNQDIIMRRQCRVRAVLQGMENLYIFTSSIARSGEATQKIAGDWRLADIASGQLCDNFRAR